MRLAPQVTLPDDLATGWGKDKNPIALHVRRAFQRNKTDTSPRIIYPALSAGYRMLEVLHAAATSPTSTHYSSVISFLQSRLEERKRSLDNYVPPPPKPDAPRPGTIPLLVNVTPQPTRANPNPEIEYAIPSRPRPQSELGGSGQRRIPQMDFAGDFPFLRLGKPQSKLLSRVIRQKLSRRIERGAKLQRFAREDLEDARLEDKWEGQVQVLQNLQAQREAMDFEANLTRAESYAHAVHQYGIEPTFAQLENERKDLVARADAMRRLIAQETVLAAEEKVQKHKERRAKWEAKMLELHGEKWRDLFPKLVERDKYHEEKIKAIREKATEYPLLC
ncbi:hypothetical protein GGS21DRAFT_40692 [Xylaria nigripes]|nr:hypothetical protein GGS21DRAFT_40692 [Xylaria nigripes]